LAVKANGKVIGIPHYFAFLYQMIMAVLPEVRADRYAAVKKVCYLETPVASQCIVAKTIRDDKKVKP